LGCGELAGGEGAGEGESKGSEGEEKDVGEHG
jgi:hypothetical protein